MARGIDRKDRQILYELDIDSRQGDAGIGRKVKLSREVVAYRIRRMRQEGVIERFYTVNDLAKLGLTSYKMYFQFQNLSVEKRKEIVQFFLKHENFEWLGECYGTWDMIVGVWAENVHAFNSIFLSFLNKYGQYVMNKATTTTLAVPHFRKEYLVGREMARIPPVAFGGEPKREELDGTDMEILRILADNARLPTIRIAELAKVSPKTVAYRISELRKKGVIQAFRVTTNLRKLGYSFFKVFLYLQRMNGRKLRQFVRYCARHPNITYLILCVGPWDVEVEFEIESLERFNDSMQDMKRKFGDMIRGVESVIIYEDYGGPKYFPGRYGKLE